MSLKRRTWESLTLAASVAAMSMVVLTGCDTSAPAAPTKAPAAPASTQAASAAAQPAAKVSEVKIGIIMPLTGGTATIGNQGKAGSEVAVEEINAKGGIKSLGGAKMVLVPADTQGKPEVAATETERLALKENVSVIMGAYASGTTFPATEVSERLKVPWVVHSAVKDEITERGFKYVFRPCNKSMFDDKEMLSAVAYFKKETGKGPTNVALLYEGTDWGRSVGDGLKKQVDSYGLKIVMDESYTQGMSSFQSQILKIKSSGAEAVFLAQYTPDHMLFNKGAMENKLNLPYGLLSLGAGAEDPAFYEQMDPKSFAYMFVQEDWDISGPDKQPWIADASKKIQAKINYPINSYAAMGYSNMYIIADALERAASADREKLRDALSKTNITSGPPLIMGYTGIKFDETGQNTMSHGVISQNLNGKRTILFPVENKADPSAKPVWPVPNWEDRK